VVSGNGGDGVNITGQGAASTTIVANLIGLNAARNPAIGNAGAGIFIGDRTTGTTVGGLSNAGNTISGNRRGVAIQNSGDNLVRNNAIGVDGLQFAAPFGNLLAGVDIAGSAARSAAARTATAILGNSIHDYRTLGIDLQSGSAGVDTNDLLDPDTGANQGQNYPLITCVGTDGTSTTVAGTLNSLPLTMFRIDIFFNDACGAQGVGEGEFFRGFVDVTTDAAGNASFNVTLPFANARASSRRRPPIRSTTRRSSRPARRSRRTA
jgi:hypothetical protein